MGQSFSNTPRIDIGDGKEINLYNAEGVSINIIRDGQVITLRNFQDGDMVSGDKTNNKLETMSDPQGSTGGARNNDRQGTITTTLQQGSTSNELLSDLYNNDEIFGMWVTYEHERYGSDYCFIQKSPTAPFGKNVPTRQWQVSAFKYDYNGNNK